MTRECPLSGGMAKRPYRLQKPCTPDLAPWYEECGPSDLRHGQMMTSNSAISARYLEGISLERKLELLVLDALEPLKAPSGASSARRGPCSGVLLSLLPFQVRYPGGSQQPLLGRIGRSAKVRLGRRPRESLPSVLSGRMIAGTSLRAKHGNPLLPSPRASRRIEPAEREVHGESSGDPTSRACWAGIAATSCRFSSREILPEPDLLLKQGAARLFRHTH